MKNSSNPWRASPDPCYSLAIPDQPPALILCRITMAYPIARTTAHPRRFRITMPFPAHNRCSHITMPFLPNRPPSSFATLQCHFRSPDRLHYNATPDRPPHPNLAIAMSFTDDHPPSVPHRHYNVLDIARPSTPANIIMPCSSIPSIPVPS